MKFFREKNRMLKLSGLINEQEDLDYDFAGEESRYMDMEGLKDEDFFEIPQDTFESFIEEEYGKYATPEEVLEGLKYWSKAYGERENDGDFEGVIKYVTSEVFEKMLRDNDIDSSFKSDFQVYYDLNS